MNGMEVMWHWREDKHVVFHEEFRKSRNSSWKTVEKKKKENMMMMMMKKCRRRSVGQINHVLYNLSKTTDDTDGKPNGQTVLANQIPGQNVPCVAVIIRRYIIGRQSLTIGQQLLKLTLSTRLIKYQQSSMYCWEWIRERGRIFSGLSHQCDARTPPDGAEPKSYSWYFVVSYFSVLTMMPRECHTVGRL